jgi:hypothetical protein
MDKQSEQLTRWLVKAIASRALVSVEQLEPDANLSDLGLELEDLRRLAKSARRYLVDHDALQPRVSVSELAAAKTLVGVLALLNAHATGSKVSHAILAGWIRRILEELFPPPGKAAATMGAQRRRSRKR